MGIGEEEEEEEAEDEGRGLGDLPPKRVEVGIRSDGAR